VENRSLQPQAGPRGDTAVRKTVSLVVTAMTTLTLVVLAGTSAAAVAAMSRSNDRVTETRQVLTQLGLVRDAVSDEAFAEASYRRAPTDATWSLWEEAMDAVAPMAESVRGDLDRRDALSLSRLILINIRYADQVAATRRQTRSDTDDRVAGPALAAMRDLLQSMIDTHRDEVSAATRQQSGVITRLGVLLPLVFLIAFGVLVWAWLLNRRERHDLRREAADAEARALTDPLTGLPNRAALLATVTSILRTPDRQAALLLLDLDRFKPVNDTFGHPAGDAVLREVAKRLRDAIRAGDLAARLGGDEFAVVLPSGGDARAVAQRILHAFETPFVVDGSLVGLGVSIGIALTDPSQAGTALLPEALFHEADQALYRAKDGGRARMEFAPAGRG
jgi:diguanylate cyclase (GGDEF)-like protein